MIMPNSLPKTLPNTLRQYYSKYNDNSYLQQLIPDQEDKKNYPNKISRPVISGHYVSSVPTKLSDPVMISHSTDLMKLLNLNRQIMESNDMLRFLSGDLPFDSPTWVTPYALSIYGQKMIDNCPYKNDTGYGDGRAHSIGEFVIDGKRWELQLKGSGKTPFSRSGDGRAVLRSSIREYLVSEAMHHLKVPTTRALSLIISTTEQVPREWYDTSKKTSNVSANITVKSNPTAIVCRVSESFIRVGHIELFSRRVTDTTQSVNQSIYRSNGAKKELELLFRHMVFREYPEFVSYPLEDMVHSVLKEFAKKIILMVTHWIRVGFVQSNFNSDNCLVSGKTMDYGPFGFLERYDPTKNFWVGSGDHFSFMNQMNAAKKNYLTFASSTEPLLDRRCLSMEQLEENFDLVAQKNLRMMWRQKLGLDELEWAGTVEGLMNRLLVLMNSVDVDYTIFWRQLSDLPLLIGLGDKTIYLHMSKAFYDPVITSLWKQWFDDYCSLLRKLSTDLVKLSSKMKSYSPKYIPREWMLAKAYTDAENNSFEMLYELEKLFRNPYDEQTDLESRYYVLTPLHIVTNKPGISSMTCSS